MAKALSGDTSATYMPSPAHQVIMHCWHELEHARSIGDSRMEWHDLFNLLKEIEGKEDCELFFQIGQLCGRLSKPSDKDIHAGLKARISVMEREAPILKRNLALSACKDMVQKIALARWRLDTEKKVRVAEMARQVWNELRNIDLLDDFRQVLPSQPDRLKDWIRDVAPDYAQRAGRPKEKK